MEGFVRNTKRRKPNAMKSMTVIPQCVEDMVEPGKEFVTAMPKRTHSVNCANKTENLQPQRRSITRSPFQKVVLTQEII